MNLKDYLPTFTGGAAAVIAAVQTGATYAGLRSPSFDQLADLVASTAENRAVTSMQAWLQPQLEAHVAEFTALYGGRPGGPSDAADQYDSLLDDWLHNWLEQPWLKEWLGPSWIGQNSVGAQAHDPAEVIKLARNMSAQIVREIVTREVNVAIHNGQATHAQMPEYKLLALGIRRDDIMPLVMAAAAPAGVTHPTEAAPVAAQPAVDVAALKAVVDPLVLHLGQHSGEPPEAVLGIVAQLASDKPQLVQAVVERYGIDAGYAPYAQQYFAAIPTAKTDILNMLTVPAATEAAKPARRKGKGGTRANEDAATGAAASSAPAATPTGEVPPSVFAALGDGGASDRDLADLLGMSRPTINNAKNGKGTPPKLSAEQRKQLADLIIRKSQVLHEAYTALSAVQ
jgi:hypothetical protein